MATTPTRTQDLGEEVAIEILGLPDAAALATIDYLEELLAGLRHTISQPTNIDPLFA